MAKVQAEAAKAGFYRVAVLVSTVDANNEEFVVPVAAARFTRRRLFAFPDPPPSMEIHVISYGTAGGAAQVELGREVPGWDRPYSIQHFRVHPAFWTGMAGLGVSSLALGVGIVAGAATATGAATGLAGIAAPILGAAGIAVGAVAAAPPGEE